jgi:hypothetical protein
VHCARGCKRSMTTGSPTKEQAMGKRIVLGVAGVLLFALTGFSLISSTDGRTMMAARHGRHYFC